MRQAELGRGPSSIMITRSMRKFLEGAREVRILSHNSSPSWRTALLLGRALNIAPQHHELLAANIMSPRREPRKMFVDTLDRDTTTATIVVCGSGYAERLGLTYLRQHAVAHLPENASFQLNSPGSALLFSYLLFRLHRNALWQIRRGTQRQAPPPFDVRRVIA